MSNSSLPEPAVPESVPGEPQPPLSSAPAPPAEPAPPARSAPGKPRPDSSDVAADESSFADLLTQFEQEHRAHEERDQAPTLDGVVLSVGEEAVLVDIGRKHEGILTRDQVADATGSVKLKPGDKVTVTAGGRDENGYHRLSLFKVVVPRDFSALERAFADKAIIPGTVEEQVKGGFRVDIGIRAFLPASRSGARDQAEMERLVGQQIECRITKLEIDREAERADAVVDRRAVLEERAARAREEAFQGLREGAVVSGVVRSVMEFGAFVDLGGVDGLLHVSDMSWVRGAKPHDIVKVGDRVEVKILKIAPDTRKIALGLKQLQADPWTAAAGAFEAGQRIRGKVTRVADFGAFVELKPGVEGMIHVSEMSWSKKQRRPADILKPGEMVEVVILSVNAAEKRIALGLKQALGDPWEEAPTRYPVGSVVEAPVSSLMNFGAFVELADGLEGMIHIGDITSEKRLQHPKEVLAVGQKVRAQVLEIDQERRRIRLGIRQLEPTSADEYIGEHKVGDVVSGRLVEVGKERAKVELGEGVMAVCQLPAAKPAGGAPEAARPAAADLGSLTALLAAKWKQGTVPSQAAGGEGVRAGQVRQFRILALDPGQKRIELELAG